MVVETIVILIGLFNIALIMTVLVGQQTLENDIYTNKRKLKKLLKGRKNKKK